MKPIAAALCLLWICTPLAAAPQKLSLDDALARARDHNLELLAARERRAVALAGVRAAGQLPNPSASFGVLRDSPHESLFFDQPVELGGKRHQRIELARQEGVLTDVEIAALERDVRRRVREAYFVLALAVQITRQRADVAALAHRLLDIAQTRFQTGDVPQLEVIQAELEVARTETDLQVASQEQKVAASRLNALLNEPSGSEWDLSSPLDQAPPEPPLDEILARAVASNPELRQLLQLSSVEQKQRDLFRAERIPDLGLEFGVDFNAPREFRYGPRGQITVGLPLFNRNQGEIAGSEASLRALAGQAAAMQRSVAGEVEAEYLELDAQHTQVALYRKNLLPAAQKLETMAEDSYRSGKAGILTVLDAQRNVQQVEQEYLNSLFSLQAAFAELEATVGASLD